MHLNHIALSVWAILLRREASPVNLTSTLYHFGVRTLQQSKMSPPRGRLHLYREDIVPTLLGTSGKVVCSSHSSTRLRSTRSLQHIYFLGMLQQVSLTQRGRRLKSKDKPKSTDLVLQTKKQRRKPTDLLHNCEFRKRVSDYHQSSTRSPLRVSRWFKS